MATGPLVNGATAMSESSDDLLFFDEPEQSPLPAANQPVWKVLLVDDDHDVHAATTLALGTVPIEGRQLDIQSAYSGAQARDILATQQDFALAIVDVVMENENAGLDLVRHIRDELHNRNMRIILRTGQPGYAPEIETIKNLDINDYKTKSELTRTRLFTSITIALRAYALICRLDAGRQGLEQVLTSMRELSDPASLSNFSSGLVTQLCALLNVPTESLVCAILENPDSYPVVLAGGGQFADWTGLPLDTIPDPRICSNLHRTLASRRSSYDDGTNLFISGNDKRALAAFIDMPHPPTDVERQLLDVFCSNISATLEHLQLFEAVNTLAYTDTELSIPNRNALLKAIDDAARSDARLVLVDIDDFSKHLSHADEHFADSILVAVAIRLSTAFSDRTCVARLAGDLFAVLGPSGEVSLAAVHDLFSAPFTIEDVEPQRLSVTMGAARTTDDAPGQPSLIKRAEMALLAAKVSQRGFGLQFDAALLASNRTRQQMTRDLHAAFEADQLSLLYQPIVDLQTGRYNGAEALLRWPAPHGDVTLPKQFVPIAEQSGLIVRLGYWVIEQALAWRAALQDTVTPDFRVTVNVATTQLHEPDFAQRLNALLIRSGVKAHQLELELTDANAVLRNTELINQLSRIQQLGITIAIDDFGNSRASLLSLRALKLKRFKLDRTAFPSQAADGALPDEAQWLLIMATQLGLTTCAEGIETEAQLESFQAQGCREGQGYWLCPPLDASALADRLAST